MNQLTFNKGFRDNDEYRRSFNQLAQQTFGIRFEEWYQKGYWTDLYEPHSFCDGDRIVANVSVNKMELMINGEKKRAIQIGTVMTHPDYRNRGLSASLMNRVLTDYDDYDLIYLFANESVLQFYPKFGFEAIEEYQYTMSYSQDNSTLHVDLRKLDVKNEQDLKLIYHLSSTREPISHRFGSIHNPSLIMFYALNVFPNSIFYHDQEEVIVMYQMQDHELHLYDVISKKPVDIHKVISWIASDCTDEVIFYFTPEDKKGDQFSKQVIKGSDVLFVRSKGLTLSFPFKHPITSQA